MKRFKAQTFFYRKCCIHFREELPQHQMNNDDATILPSVNLNIRNEQPYHIWEITNRKIHKTIKELNCKKPLVIELNPKIAHSSGIPLTMCLKELFANLKTRIDSRQVMPFDITVVIGKGDSDNTAILRNINVEASRNGAYHIPMRRCNADVTSQMIIELRDRYQRLRLAA